MFLLPSTMEGIGRKGTIACTEWLTKDTLLSFEKNFGQTKNFETLCNCLSKMKNWLTLCISMSFFFIKYSNYWQLWHPSLEILYRIKYTYAKKK